MKILFGIVLTWLMSKFSKTEIGEEIPELLQAVADTASEMAAALVENKKGDERRNEMRKVWQGHRPKLINAAFDEGAELAEEKILDEEDRAAVISAIGFVKEKLNEALDEKNKPVY